MTIIATGMGNTTKPQLSVVQTAQLKTGTDNHSAGEPNWSEYDLPPGFRPSNRSNRGANGEVAKATRTSGSNVDMDIPAFLRRQAD